MISESGTLAYISRTEIASELGRTLVWVDREGNEEPLDAPPYKYISSSISHDGKRIALLATNPSDIWIYDIDRKIPSNLTLDKSREWQHVWTPDDKTIIYYSEYEGLGGIYWRAYDGAGKVEKLSPNFGLATVPWSITPNGKFLLCSAAMTWQKVDIGMLSLEGDHEHKTLLQYDCIENYPMISPDGQWMAYFSNESGTNEVYIRSFPDVEAKREPVSSGGGTCPLWSPDGKELFYTGGGSVMAVTVQTEPTLHLGKPKILFPYKYLPLSQETVMV